MFPVQVNVQTSNYKEILYSWIGTNGTNTKVVGTKIVKIKSTHFSIIFFSFLGSVKWFVMAECYLIIKRLLLLLFYLLVSFNCTAGRGGVREAEKLQQTLKEKIVNIKDS